MNKLFKIKIQTLTPVHIGAGQEKDLVEGADFIRHDKKLYFLNTRKISEDYGVEMLCNAFLNPSSDGLRRRLEEKGDFEDYVKKSYPFESNVPLKNGIKSQIKNPVTGNPLIPGSSLKGAIRSLIFASLKSRNDRNEEDVLGSLRNNDDFLRFIQVSDCTMNKLSYLNTKTFNLKKQSEVHFIGAWKHGRQNSNKQFNETGFNFVYECISADSKGVSTIGLNPKLFNKVCSYNTPYYSEKEKILSGEIASLFHLINRQTENYLNKEISFYQKYRVEETENILVELTHIQRLLNQSNNKYCILRMSAGSGFHSIIGDWKFDTHEINGLNTKKKPYRGTYNGVDSAKSRKIAIEDGNFYPMGFVMLSLASDEEYDALINRERESINIKIAEIAQKEADALRLAEEEKAKQAEQALIDKIKELRAQFDELFEKGQLDEAANIVSQMKELSPDNELVLDAEIRLSEEINLREKIETLSKEYSQLIESGKDEEAILILEKLKGIDAANIQEYNQNIQKIRHKIKIEKARSGGLSELREKLNGKDINVLSKLMKQYIKDAGSIPSSDYELLYEILMTCYSVENKKTLKKWHGKSAMESVYWKRISGWLVDKDDVNVLFDRFQKEQNL